MSVLVLNASFAPLNVVSERRAIVLLIKDKAQLIEAREGRISSESLSLPRPTVIRLVAYVRVPYRFPFPVTRRGILARDGYACQYCGASTARNELTIDHVVPRSHGGRRTWQNLVAACLRCNLRKGGRTPAQAGMQLRSTPCPPRYVAVAFVAISEGDERWRKYIEPNASRKMA